MIPIIAFSVLFIFFCVLAFFSAKNWLLRHVFLMLGVFIMSMVFLLFAGMTLKTHSVWRSRHATVVADLERADNRIAELSGPLAIDDEEQSLPQLQSDLSRLLLERGRVWRGAQVVGADGNAVELNMSAWGNSGCVRAEVDGDIEPVAEGGAAPAAGEPPQMTEKMLVHAFLEGSVAQLDADQLTVLYGESGPEAQTRGPCTIPAAYVGHYAVTGIGENGVTLEAVQPLDNQQLAMIDQGGSWTLYEVLPIDDHSTLSGMPPESLQSLIGPLAGDLPADKVSAVISDFGRDGSAADGNDPPGRVWVKVKFTADYSIPVDIDAEAEGSDRSFDVRGRAIPAYLRQGTPTEFKVGDVVEFDSTTANQLVQEGNCELVDEPSRYVRPLRNYGLIFQHEHDAISDVQSSINQTNSENGTLIASAAQVRQQIAYREEEKRKLGEDLENYGREGVTIAQYRDELVRLRQLQLQELGRLYEYNNSLRLQMSGF